MRLLMLTNIFPVEGSPHGASFIRSRAAALEAAGHQVDVVAIGPAHSRTIQPLSGNFLDGRVAIHRHERVALYLSGKSAVAERRAAERVGALVTPVRYRGIMAHGMFSLAAGRIAAILSNEWAIPYSVHLHGSDVNVLMVRHPRSFVPVLEGAQGAVFVSRALGRRAESLGYSGRNMNVIPNGVDAHVFRPEANASRNRKGQPSVCFVGNLLPVKGADRLPEIFSCLVERRPGAHLTIVGDGPLRASLEKKFRGQNVTMTGRLPAREVALAMASSHVLLLPSRNEGWPTVINESYAVGTPVVGADVGGIREAVVDETHLVREGKDFAVRLVDATLAACQFSDRSRLVERARAHSWEALAELELQVLLGRGVLPE